MPAAAAPSAWDRLLAAGIEPCGLGARDTLRLEAAMNLYGSDKPDLRFGNPIHTLDDLVPGCGFGVFEKALESRGTVRCLVGSGLGNWSRKQVDEMEELVKTLRKN